MIKEAWREQGGLLQGCLSLELALAYPAECG